MGDLCQIILEIQFTAGR